MVVTFGDYNNNDTPHEISFLRMIYNADDTKDIEVLFDGLKYKGRVHTDESGRMEFKHCGKGYSILNIDGGEV